MVLFLWKYTSVKFRDWEIVPGTWFYRGYLGYCRSVDLFSLVQCVGRVTVYKEFLTPQEKRLGKKAFLRSVQSLSCVRLFATPWIAARQTSLSIFALGSLYFLLWTCLYFLSSLPWADNHFYNLLLSSF